MRLSSLGFLPGRVFNLPLGFDQKLFFKTKNVLEREYDFLISTPYKIDYLGSHYWLRKGTPLLVETIKELASRGFKVMLLGDNWNSYNFASANIKIHSPSYEEKSFYINKYKEKFGEDSKVVFKLFKSKIPLDSGEGDKRFRQHM